MGISAAERLASWKRIRWIILAILLLSVLWLGFAFRPRKTPQPPADPPKQTSSARRHTADGPTKISGGKPSSPSPAGKTRRYFGARGGTLTPEQARLLLEKDRLEEPDVAARAENAWHIINQLCKNGFPREAWSLIEESDGEVRVKGLGGFFRDADLPKAELVGMLDGLWRHDRSSALFGYWSRFTPEEFVRLDMADFPLRGNADAGAFRKTLTEMISGTFDPAAPGTSLAIRSELLAMAAARANEGMFGYGELKKLFQEDPTKDGFAYWEMLKTVDPQWKTTRETYSGLEANLIRAMTTQDAGKTMGLALQPDTQEAKWMHIALTQWLGDDYAPAEKWYQENRARLTVDQSDRAAVAFLRTASRMGDYEVALKWYDQIQQPKWQDGLRYERGFVQRKLREATPK